MFGDQKIVSQTMKIHDFKASIEEGRILTPWHFTFIFQESEVLFDLVEKNQNMQPKLESQLPEIQAILHEFADLASEELPPMLPLTCDVQHAIDLLPRASLSNMGAYNMSLVKHKEM